MTVGSAAIVATQIYREWGSTIFSLKHCSWYAVLLAIFKGIQNPARGKFFCYGKMYVQATSAPVAHGTPSLTSFNDNPWSESTFCRPVHVILTVQLSTDMSYV